MTYGVVDTGFARKPLNVILAEFEDAARVVFGAGVVVDPESPLGQQLGLFALLASQLWELGEDTYQSYDPDQAEGVRLDTLAKLRLISRATGELDPALRQAITNRDRARTDLADLVRAVTDISGVTYAQVFVNDTDSIDANGQSGHTVAVAAIGGDDDAIAQAIRAHVVPGIGSFGNLRIDTAIDGVCRSIWIVRPALIEVTLEIEVNVTNDRSGCPPPSPTTIGVGLAEELMNDYRLINGADVTDYAVRSALECRYPNVEYVSGLGYLGEGSAGSLPLAIAFDEIAEFAATRIVVSIA